MSGPSEKDQEFDAYLRGDSPLSRAYKEDARELPPAHLDAQVLAEAHRADDGRGKQLTRSPFSGSWMVPASVTAVVVLAVSVAVLLPEGQPGYERQRERFEDTTLPNAESTLTGRSQQRKPEQAPEAEYAPAPPGALESDETPSGNAPPETAPVVPAPKAAPALDQTYVLPEKVHPTAPADAARPDADTASDSLRNRSRAQSRIEAAGEEGLESRAKSEAVSEPDAWLQRIEILIGRGQLEAARESLADFRRTYPGTRVPQQIIEALEDD
jgi:hypothetical protein